MNKLHVKAVACIEIGSNGTRMHISQWDGNNIVSLDRLERTTHMGQEVFATGYISFETIRELSGILEGFCAVAREYQVTRIYTVATTALREAVNKAYVLDHIAIQNGLEVQVLEDSQANVFLFSAMEERRGNSKGTELMVFGGTGTIDFALRQNGKTLFTHSMHTGLIKINQMLREASEFSSHTDLVAREYIQTFFARSNRMEDLLQAGSIVFGLGDMRPLLTIFEISAEGGELDRETILETYETYHHLSLEQIAARHRLNMEQSGTVFAALSLLAVLLESSAVKRVRFVQVNLVDAMLSLYLRPDARREYNRELRESIRTSAVDLSRRYRCDLRHASQVSAHALTLYDKLRKLHGLSKRQSLLLETACILHECGQYTNTSDTQEASFDLVKDAQIYGLGSGETLLAANIISPQNLLGLSQRRSRQQLLQDEDMMFAAKMHAILHLADALDFSHKQKAVITGVEQKSETMTLEISVRIQEAFTLEQLMFRQGAELFQEIFGLTPVLNIESIYQMGGRQ